MVNKSNETIPDINATLKINALQPEMRSCERTSCRLIGEGKYAHEIYSNQVISHDNKILICLTKFST